MSKIADQMRREAANWRARAAQFREVVAKYEEQARILEEAADRLTAGNKFPKVSSVKPSDDQGDARRRGRPTETQHLFAAGLAAQGITLADWARKHGYPRVQAQKWMMPPPHGRRIPERAAKLIEAELNVPANEEVWTTGIKRD